MKIQDFGISNHYSGQTSGAHEANRANGVAGRYQTDVRNAGTMDRVDVSETADTASRVLAHDAVQREEMVAKLAEEYRSGRYTVDSAALASAIAADYFRSSGAE